MERALADRTAGRHRNSALRLRSVGISRLARCRTPHHLFSPSRHGCLDACTAGLRLVFSGDGAVVPVADVAGWRFATLPCRYIEFFRNPPQCVTPLQPGTHVALATCDFLGRDILPRCRHFPGADDCGPRTAPPALAGLCPAWSTGVGRVRQHDRGVGWYSGMAFPWLVMVRRPRI